MKITSNPLEKYIVDMFQYFFEESKRLKSKEPLESFKLIVDAFLLVQRKLGGLEHDVALDTIKGEFKHVRRDIADGLKQSLRKFWRYRTLASRHAKEEQQNKILGQSYLTDLKAQIEELRPIDSSMAKDADDIYKQFVELEKVDISFSSTWRAVSWTGLWVDSKLFAIYLRYLGTRMRVFLQFHAFIFLVPILVMGIGYSFASKSAIETLSAISPQSPLLGPVLLVGVYAVKKYVIDKRLKAMQKRLEERLFRPLSAKLILTRTLALQVRTLRKGRKSTEAKAA